MTQISTVRLGSRLRVRPKPGKSADDVSPAIARKASMTRLSRYRKVVTGRDGKIIVEGRTN
jgi:hypothetical protein